MLSGEAPLQTAFEGVSDDCDDGIDLCDRKVFAAMLRSCPPQEEESGRLQCEWGKCSQGRHPVWPTVMGTAD